MTTHHRISSSSARALALGLALGLTALPTRGFAAPTAAPAPTTDVAAPEPAPEPAEPAAEPTDVTAPAEPTAPTEPTEPTDVAEPEPEPQPVAEPEPTLAPAPVITTPEPTPAVAPVADESYDPAKARRLRLGGAYTMIGGGGIAVVGLGLGIAFTVIGKSQSRKLEGFEDAYALDECSSGGGSVCDTHRTNLDDTQNKIDAANGLARVGGILLLGGAVATIVGGVVYRRGVRMDEDAQRAKIRVSPTLGGAVLSGRF